MKVLIAVDGSAGAAEALRQVTAWLVPQRDRVSLYYCPPMMPNDATSGEDPLVFERAVQSMAHEILDEAHARLPSGLQAAAERSVGIGSPGHEIVAIAEEWGAELIVVGARGLGPVRRLLMGSVSSSVVRHSTLPVLVVRAAQAHHEHLRILLAAPDDAAAARLLALASRFTWPADATGHLLSVVPPMYAGHVPEWLEKRLRSPQTEAMSQAWVAEHAAELTAKRVEMDAFCRDLPAPFHDTRPIVVEGNPTEQILHHIEQKQIALAVIGAKQGGAWTRLLLGSTSEAVASHAPCSVLVVRDRT